MDASQDACMRIAVAIELAHGSWTCTDFQTIYWRVYTVAGRTHVHQASLNLHSFVSYVPRGVMDVRWLPIDAPKELEEFLTTLRIRSKFMRLVNRARRLAREQDKL